jgi:peptidoglycan/LPS O-acetylase OafA/YrhL
LTATPLHSPDRGNRRIADIEFLRGVAIIFVLIFHIRRELIAWPMPVLDHILDDYVNFWPGVDIFFAVSGFVIARSLIPSLQACVSAQERVRVMMRFWIRRAWRLLPAAWLWLGMILLASAVLNRSGAFEPFHVNFESVIAGMMSVANVRFAQTFPFQLYGPSSPYWSLSLEEQFYLVLPLLVIVARHRLVLVLAAVVAIVFCLPQTALLGTFRVHAILLGVLLAIFSRHPAYRLLEPTALGASALARWGTLGLILLFLGALAPLGQKIVAFSFDVIALLSAALVFIASFDRDYLCRESWLKPVMLWIGGRSYAIYLVHLPVYCLTREIWFRLSPPDTVFGGSDALLFVATAAPLVLILAELNYRFVEMPGRLHGIRLTSRVVAAPVEATNEPAEVTSAPAEAAV